MAKEKTKKVIFRGILSPVYTVAPVKRVEKEGKIRLYIKPRGHEEMQIERVTQLDKLCHAEEHYQIVLT